MSKNDVEARVAELEVQIAFQEDHLQKLNDALYQQQVRIDSLEVGIRHYEKRLQEINDGLGDIKTEQEIPPHY